MTTILPASALHVDAATYGRFSVNDLHVTRLAAFLACGVTFPPLLVDAESHGIADGVHRWHAYQQFAGPDAPVSCELRAFASPAEALLVGAAINVAHGLGLDPSDLTRIIITCEALGVSAAEIRATLQLSDARYVTLAHRVAFAPDGVTPVVLKGATARLFAGKVLTTRQQELNASASASLTSHVLQLRRALARDGIDWDDGRVLAALQQLALELTKALAQHGIAA